MVTINWTSSSLIGGRPGDLGWRHLFATRRRCQRSSVPGVTIRWPRSALGRSSDSAANTARSVQASLGFGFVRRSTATSCRNTSISVFFDACDRAKSASQDRRFTKIR
jgi:hypothetical protein